MAKYDSIYEGRIPSAVKSNCSDNVLVKHHSNRLFKLFYYIQSRLSYLYKLLNINSKTF